MLAPMPSEEDRAEVDMPADNAAGRPWARAAGDGIRNLGPRLNVLGKRVRTDAGWPVPDRPSRQTEHPAQSKRKR